MGKKTTDEMIAEIYALAVRADAKIDTMQEDMNVLKKDVELVKNVLDRYAGMLDDDEIERIALSKQVDSHEDWIARAAIKTNVRYSN
jgi:ABC-type dipeptide/oligopeptide/nickel transport system ATPase subunit